MIIVEALSLTRPRRGLRTFLARKRERFDYNHSKRSLSRARAAGCAHSSRVGGRASGQSAGPSVPRLFTQPLQHWIEAGRVQINGAPARLRQPALESATVVIHPERAPDVRA